MEPKIDWERYGAEQERLVRYHRQALQVLRAPRPHARPTKRTLKGEAKVFRMLLYRELRCFAWEFGQELLTLAGLR